MSEQEEKDLIRKVQENNLMLKQIVQYLNTNDAKDFSMNVLANIISNRFEKVISPY